MSTSAASTTPPPSRSSARSWKLPRTCYSLLPAVRMPRRRAPVSGRRELYVLYAHVKQQPPSLQRPPPWRAGDDRRRDRPGDGRGPDRAPPLMPRADRQRRRGARRERPASAHRPLVDGRGSPTAPAGAGPRGQPYGRGRPRGSQRPRAPRRRPGANRPGSRRAALAGGAADFGPKRLTQGERVE